MAQLLNPIQQKFTDANGDPLVGGKVFSYQAGTTTPLDTYTNQQESGTNTNPIILDANGEASIWLGTQAYKFVIKDSNDVLIKTIDNVSIHGLETIVTGTIADGAVTSEKIATGGVETANILDNAVTNAKMATDSVDTDEIVDDAVTTAKIADSNVTTAKIADNAVTQAKRAALGQQVSGSSGSFSTVGTGSDVDVTNLSVSITTTGRPVYIGIIGDGGSSILQVRDTSSPSSSAFGSIKIKRESTTICSHFLQGDESQSTPGSSVNHIDVPASGTYTYKVSILCSASRTFFVQNFKLIAFEL